MNYIPYIPWGLVIFTSIILLILLFKFRKIKNSYKFELKTEYDKISKEQGDILHLREQKQNDMFREQQQKQDDVFRSREQKQGEKWRKQTKELDETFQKRLLDERERSREELKHSKETYSKQLDKSANDILKAKDVEHKLTIKNKLGAMKAEMEAQKAVEIKEARNDAAKRSRHIIDGYVFEKLVPFFAEWPYDPRDMSFYGAPIDYMCFEGLIGEGPITVVLVEVKKDTAGLNSNQIRIRQAIVEGRIRFDLCKIDTKKLTLKVTSYKYGDGRVKGITKEIGHGFNEGLLK